MTRPLHVAMVIHEYYPIVGGAQRQLAMLAPLLRRQGIGVTVVTRRFSGLAAFANVDGVDVYRVAAPGPKAVASFSFIAGATRRLLHLKPDVIHAYNLFSPLTTATLAKQLLGAALVVKVLRGGTLGDMDRMLKRRFGRQRFEILRRQVDAFVAISNEIASELAAVGVPDARRVFIPNGVDTDHFVPVTATVRAERRRQLHLPPGPLAVYAGRLVPEKHVDRLLAAWQDVHAVYPRASLLLLGEGQEENALRLQAGPGVIFGGRVDDVAPYLQAADLFVLPSATEGLSNSLLEAMATGLPVLATAVGGAPDVIGAGQSGRLIAVDDVPALQAALLELLGDTRLRSRLGHSARQRMLADYSLDAVARSLCQLYEQVSAGSAIVPQEMLQP